MTLHCYTVDWFCECFKKLPYMMQWKHTLVISFFGVQGGGGREGGGNSVVIFFSIYSKSLRKCTEKFWRSWKKFYINEIKLKEIWPPPIQLFCHLHSFLWDYKYIFPYYTHQCNSQEVKVNCGHLTLSMCPKWVAKPSLD